MSGIVKLQTGGGGNVNLQGASTASDVTVTVPAGNVTLRDSGTKIAFGDFVPTDWTSNISGNGYQKLPSGLIMQWASVNYHAANGATGTTVNFPIAFPSAALRVVAVDYGSGAYSWGANPISASQCKVWAKNSGTYADATANLIAIGY